MQTVALSEYKSYAGNHEGYVNWLLGKAKWENKLYIDPDEAYSNNSDHEYYDKLIIYLNEMEKNKGGDDKWTYAFSPLTKGNEIPGSIVAKGKETIYLRSDQFGFSAPKLYNGKECAMTSKYPYWKFFQINKNETKARFISNIIWNMRTIGGSFLWPLQKQGRNWQCTYNKLRGAGSYIEDRVDLTLLEIKHALDGEYDKENFTKDVLYEQYKNDSTGMKLWLNHFKDFGNYVDLLNFKPFVDEEYWPVSLLSGKRIEDCKNEKKIIDMSEQELEEMLINMNNKTLERSKSLLV